VSNVKIENSKLCYLSTDKTRLLGKNLLEGITPKVTALGNEPFVCEMYQKHDMEYLSFVTDDENITTHIDLFGAPFSITYDLGETTPVETLQISGYERYVMSGFKLFASDSREDLYNDENMLWEYHRTDDPNLLEKDFVYTLSGSLRYFGFMATETCLRDNILRLARIALYNDFYSTKHRMVERKTTYKQLEGIVPEVEGKYKGSPKAVAGKIAFEESDMLTAESDITLTYKSDTALDINRLYVVGNNIDVTAVVCDGKPAEFTCTFEPTYCGEEINLLSGDFSGSELEIKLVAGSVIDLVFADTCLRRAAVDFSEVICPDFVGTGTNLIPTFYSDMGIEGGSNDVFWEMEKHHISKARPHCARMWFQIDWITDNEKDYYNRKYTFDSKNMKSVKKYLEACRENGVEVLFNFGWKISYSIQDWFPVGGVGETYPYGLRQAAPRDLRQYGIALADTLEHLILECGYDNIKYVTFYNEPRYTVNVITGDFAAQGDKVGYWAMMLRYAKHYVDQSKVKGMVDFWGAEEDHWWPEWMSGLNMLAPDCFTTHTIHRYNLSYNDICKLYREEVIPNLDGKPAILTEYGNSYRTSMAWDTNHINNLLAGANLGVSGAFNWILSSAPLVDPLNWWHGGPGDMDRSFSLWNYLPAAYNLNHTSEIYYELSLWAHYVPNHCKSVKTELVKPYSDLRVCAFTNNGDYTICVENKGDNPTTEIEINLNKAINKKLYKYVYRRRTDQGEGNLTVPHSEAEIFVGDTLRDTLGEGYEFAVYSTIPPIRQVLMSQCDVRVEAGATVELSAEVLGCDFTPTWSISKSLMEGATLEGTTVKVPATAKKGDMLSVKAELPTGEFGIAIVQVV